MSETYTPHPGSRIDRAVSEHEVAPTSHHETAAVAEAGLVVSEPVPVRGSVLQEAAAEGIYRTMSVAASGIRQLLPQDPERVRAVVLSVDQDVVLCMTKELAQSADNTVASVPFPEGFYLPKGTPGIEIRNKGLVWVANTSTSTATRVSVLVEHADPSTNRAG